MKILARLAGESVLCVLPDGSEIEVTLISISGEDVAFEPDINLAVQLIQNNLAVWSNRGS